MYRISYSTLLRILSDPPPGDPLTSNEIAYKAYLTKKHSAADLEAIRQHALLQTQVPMPKKSSGKKKPIAKI